MTAAVIRAKQVSIAGATSQLVAPTALERSLKAFVTSGSTVGNPPNFAAKSSIC
jgi:hypothetical protein